MNAEQNSTVSLPQLIQLLADLTGVDAAESRKFLHEFFALVEEILVQGRSVRIKGIGSFAVENRSSGAVLFTPDAELAAAINTPFAMFEAVELGDMIPEELVEEEKPTVQAPATEEYVVAIDTPDDTPQEEEAIAESEEAEIAYTSEPEQLAEHEAAQEIALETIEETAGDAIEEDIDEDTEEAREEYNPQLYEAEPEPARRSIKGYVATAVLALAAGFALGYYTHRTVYRHYSIEAAPVEIIQATTELQEADTAVQQAVVPEPVIVEKPVEPVRDTIRSDNFLATMARRHYGCMEYWVYIYEANPGLGHPDRIRPGTVVTIPQESAFYQSSDSVTKARALRLYADIYSRYK